MNKKELTQENYNYKTLMWIFLILAIMFGLAFIAAVVQRDNCLRSIDTIGLKEMEWDCPILLEKGEYNFDSHKGILTSPSGEELKCVETTK